MFPTVVCQFSRYNTVLRKVVYTCSTSLGQSAITSMQRFRKYRITHKVCQLGRVSGTGLQVCWVILPVHSHTTPGPSNSNGRLGCLLTMFT